MPYTLLDGIDFYTKEEIDNEFSAGSVSEERERAEAAEQQLQSNITTEETRASTEEGLLSDRILALENSSATIQNSITAETTRAQAAEQANATAINNEVIRAVNAEQDNANAITAERNRALLAEGGLSNSIINESLRATNVELHLSEMIDGVNDLIPSGTTTQNPLADRAYVNEQIETNAATYRGSFATWADVPTNPNGYLPDPQANRKPEPHDYIYVRDSSGYNVQNVGTWKFEYSGDWDTSGKTGWSPVYSVNADVFSQSQMAAIDSGVTAAKVSTYDSHVADTQNPHSVTKAQVGLGNVTNTSDMDKPVSTAQQAAIQAEATRAQAAEQALNTALSAKQDALTAGSGISIQNNVISATGTINTVTYDGTAMSIQMPDGTSKYNIVNNTASATPLTITVASGATVLSDIIIIGNATNSEPWDITFVDKDGSTQKTITVESNDIVRLIYNGSGLICEHTIPLEGVDIDNNIFIYNVVVRD